MKIEKDLFKPGEKLVTVPIGKGCVLKLTEQEFSNGIKRGKILQRSESHRERIEEREKKNELSAMRGIDDR